MMWFQAEQEADHDERSLTGSSVTSEESAAALTAITEDKPATDLPTERDSTVVSSSYSSDHSTESEREETSTLATTGATQETES